LIALRDGRLSHGPHLEYFCTTCTTAQIARGGKDIILKEVRFAAVFTHPV
jgi:hypothetical protein